MATTTSQILLPPRLMNFFARYPPAVYSAKYANPPRPSLTRPKAGAPRIETASNTSSSNPNAPMTEFSITSSSSTTETTTTTIPPSETPSLTSDSAIIENPNPFLPYKNPLTGRWRAPSISLRRQADLVKLAASNGVEELLPPGRKSTEFRQQRALERGLRIKGTGEGEKVKGHKWERMKAIKLDERVKAMEGMPEMIRMWKQRGHGKWWKKYPR